MCPFLTNVCVQKKHSEQLVLTLFMGNILIWYALQCHISSNWYYCWNCRCMTFLGVYAPLKAYWHIQNGKYAVFKWYLYFKLSLCARMNFISPTIKMLLSPRYKVVVNQAFVVSWLAVSVFILTDIHGWGRDKILLNMELDQLLRVFI